jgi:hypothetical protein
MGFTLDHRDRAFVGDVDATDPTGPTDAGRTTDAAPGLS